MRGEGATYDYSPYLALCGVHEVVVGGFGGGRGEVPGGVEAHLDARSEIRFDVEGRMCVFSSRRLEVFG